MKFFVHKEVKVGNSLATAWFFSRWEQKEQLGTA